MVSVPCMKRVHLAVAPPAVDAGFPEDVLAEFRPCPIRILVQEDHAAIAVRASG